MVEFGTSSAFRGWVRVRVLGYGFGMRGRKVKSRDCALASDLVRAQTISVQPLTEHFFHNSPPQLQCCPSLYGFSSLLYILNLPKLSGTTKQKSPNMGRK